MMRKLDRLFEIVQLLRGKRLRTAKYIAEKLEISVRTVYRDINSLIASGVPIEGERGVGYIIFQSLEIPPLKFTELEYKALELGIKMVGALADDKLASAANEASIKIKDSLSNKVSEKIDPIAHIYFQIDKQTRQNIEILREGIKNSTKISIVYNNESGKTTKRFIRPLGIECWGKIWTITSWCELRDDFRVFRIDRILKCDITNIIFKNEAGKTYKDYLDNLEKE